MVDISMCTTEKPFHIKKKEIHRCGSYDFPLYIICVIEIANIEK